MPKKPGKEDMLDFLRSGIKMMQTDGVREMLKDRTAVPHAGHKLIELQRAGWGPLGFDADVGCKALDEIECIAGNEELLEVRQEFMLTAMRTYLQATGDRRPSSLEKKKPLPKAIILEFFDVCNTRMELPETQKELLTHIALHKQVPNEVIISMQKDLLEDLGFEREHACAMLSRIPQDFPNDVELGQRMQMWKSKAQSACMRAVRAHQEAGGELPRVPGAPVMDKDLAQEMAKVVPKAREQIANMSDAERKAFMGEKTFKKMEVFQNLPPDGRMAYVKKLSEEDKLEFAKTQMLILEAMQREWQAGQPGPASSYRPPSVPCTMDAVQGTSTAPVQEQMMM
mmetsp:Transcript_42324/g.78841  ORF Transcript_42324/g.78841 Transcript_42324/m.78841 type:complete len:341 (-) Transcript_42324:205-1227(-)